MSEESRGDGTIRLLFEMSRDDNPPLYDDLVRFGKGVKRVNRLRLLAHEGLRAVSSHAQSPVGGPPAAVRLAGTHAAGDSACGTVSAADLTLAGSQAR